MRLNGEDISVSDRRTGKQLFPKAARPKPLEFALEPATANRARDKDPHGKPARSAASTPTVTVSEIVGLASNMERKANVRTRDLPLSMNRADSIRVAVCSF